ncbi:MAG: hypothetical protein FJZ92_00595 [Chloroflexi bacterium]|nr:hypothetical protein [Chloroflexota bacterium]
MLYGVLCRLGRPAGEYPTLLGAVQSVSVALWQVSDTSWLVESEQAAAVVRDAVAAAIEPADFALVFPLDVAPAVWTSLAAQRYGRRFLESALVRERARRASV